MNKYDAFISFSFKDQNVVENVVNELENKYGISCWTCLEYVKSGQSYKELIPSAIKNSCVTVVFISKDSVTSTEVPKEVGIALKREKTVVPFLLDNSEYQGSLEYDLQNVNYIDATVPSFEERIKDLAKAICFASNKPFSTDNMLDKQQIKSSVIASINNTVKHSASYKTAEEMQTEFAKARVSDTIIFGAYEQDSEKWEHKEPIEWLVLAREKDRMLVISKYCLDYKSNFDCGGPWQNTPIRKWLNESFFNYAFSYEEQQIIEKIKQNTMKKIFGNIEENLFLFNNDRVFLLSYDEAEKYFLNCELRQAKPTNYAQKRKALFPLRDEKNKDGYCPWSLRHSIKEYEERANIVINEFERPEMLGRGCPHSSISSYGRYSTGVSFYDYEKEGLGIRPALWIDLKQKK